MRICRDDLGIAEPAIIGAHCLGSLIALRLAATHPELVTAIAAFGPPIYPDPKQRTPLVSDVGLVLPAPWRVPVAGSMWCNGEGP